MGYNVKTRRREVLFLIFQLLSFNAMAEEFDISLLGDEVGIYKNIDLSTFSKSGGQLPGTYYIDIYLNDNPVDSRYIKFSHDDGRLIPCISSEMLESYGVYSQNVNSVECVNFKSYVGSRVDFSFPRQELRISIPQKYIKKNPSGEISVKLWDFGIPAFLMNYNFTGLSWVNNHLNSNNSYVATLSPGVNIGKWRIRNDGVWQKSAHGSGQYTNNSTYIQRALPEIRSEITLGDAITSSSIFDAFSFRGIKLETAENMYPYSQQSFAPRVMGVAKSNAQVIVKQRGNIIYATSVPPGPFDLSDIIPSKDNGDLFVVVKESDGTEQNFIVPYSSVPILQRKGRLKYEVVLGKYVDDTSLIKDSEFAQLGIAYGLSDIFTIYGGVQLSKRYQSLVGGIGGLTSLGAASVDITTSSAKHRTSDNKLKGSALRIRYSKTFEMSGTTVAVAGYKYQSKNYMTLSDIYGNRQVHNPWLIGNQKTRIDVSLNQQLSSNFGGFYLNFIKENYYGKGNVISFGGGYNLQIGRANVLVNVSKQKIGNYNYVKQDFFSLSLSMPLGDETYSQFGIDNSDSNSSYSLGIYGNALENNDLHWGVKKSISKSNKYNEQLTAYAGYNNRYCNLYGGYTSSQVGGNFNYSLNGSVILYDEGIILSGQRNETMAIVDTKDVSGININMMPGVYSDQNGKALVSGLMPYKRNQITLNQLTFPNDIEVFQTTKFVVPTDGAIVKTSFNVESGKKVLFTVKDNKGNYIPFGSIASTEYAKAAIVGPDGEIYIAGLKEKGMIIIKSSEKKQCAFQYDLRNKKDKGGVFFLSEVCR